MRILALLTKKPQIFLDQNIKKTVTFYSYGQCQISLDFLCITALTLYELLRPIP